MSNRLYGTNAVCHVPYGNGSVVCQFANDEGWHFKSVADARALNDPVVNQALSYAACGVEHTSVVHDMLDPATHPFRKDFLSRLVFK